MINQISDWLKNAERTVIFTGAGMSTESGLPDFRTKDRGLWEKFNPDELANVNALIHNEKEFTEFYRYRLQELFKYKPHQGHHILADWEKIGVIDGIITQNVDAFHFDAGSENVMELHGSFHAFHCHNCYQSYERERYFSGETKCECGGTVRPNIVLFGEQLPQDTFRQAEVAARAADLFIVLGSSLTVSPANMFPLLAKDHGAKLVIINREPTDFDSYADATVQDMSIKEALLVINERLKQ